MIIQACFAFTYNYSVDFTVFKVGVSHRKELLKYNFTSVNRKKEDFYYCLS